MFQSKTWTVRGFINEDNQNEVVIGNTSSNAFLPPSCEFPLYTKHNSSISNDSVCGTYKGCRSFEVCEECANEFYYQINYRIPNMLRPVPRHKNWIRFETMSSAAKKNYSKLLKKGKRYVFSINFVNVINNVPRFELNTVCLHPETETKTETKTESETEGAIETKTEN